MSNIKLLASKSVRLAKQIVKKAIGLLPPPAGRLAGALAKDGGKPVRDLRFRPWRQYPSHSRWEWMRYVSPKMGHIFRSGNEGLPQSLGSEFAEKWARYCGAKYGLLVPHGTDALRLGLAAALNHDGFEYGGEVIVPNLTFIASASAAFDRRLGVALVDVDPSTLNIDPDRVEEAIIPGKTRAIMAVHLFGQPADMARLRGIAKRHSLALIEDVAQAHGAIHELGRVGSLGDVGAFSFQSTKLLSAGEGGALTTNREDIFERAYQLHNVGRARIGGQRWGHNTLGWNIRPTEYVAAVLLHRMRRIEEQQELRFARLIYLREKLADIPCLELLALGPGTVRHGCFMFVMRYRAEACDGLSIEDFIKAINAEGIPLSRAYRQTLAQQPAIQNLIENHPDYIRVLPTPVADRAVKEIFYLPHHILLGSEQDMDEIAAAFNKVFARYGQSFSRRSAPGIRAARTTPIETIAPVVEVGAAKTPIRCGVIGVGVMGQEHIEAIQRHERFSLVAVTDARHEVAHQAALKTCSRFFETAEELIRSNEVEMVVVATPHWQHPQLAGAALRAGLHVICEKPIAVTVAEADDLLSVASTSDRLFAVVHQTRFDPLYQRARALIVSGELGQINRCAMFESRWRTQAYYESSPWRGTWKGEGGGVLLNQAPHLLDRYAWLCGMPESISSLCDTSHHRIEVEDTASAILRHANRAHGMIHVSTIEYPPISRTEIACDRGRILIENGQMYISRLRGSIREKTLNDSRMLGELPMENFDVQMPPMPTRQLLDAFYSNVAATLDGNEKLVSPGIEGLHSVELANAILLSSATGKAVKLPLCREDYRRFIEEKLDLTAQAY